MPQGSPLCPASVLTLRPRGTLCRQAGSAPLTSNVRQSAVIAETNTFGWTEDRYHAVLVNEARRDLVFLMDIAHQLLEGFKCSFDELPPNLEKAIHCLLESGANIGYGEPGTSSWKPESKFTGDATVKAKQIVAEWAVASARLDFLVFVRREE